MLSVTLKPQHAPVILFLLFVQQRTDALLARRHPVDNHSVNKQENIMGKYLLGWILGVPAVVLVVIYLIAH